MIPKVKQLSASEEAQIASRALVGNTLEEVAARHGVTISRVWSVTLRASETANSEAYSELRRIRIGRDPGIKLLRLYSGEFLPNLRVLGRL